MSKHKVFVSFFHEDLSFKKRFVSQYENVFVDGSVDTGDISDNLDDETIRRIIRDDYLRDSSVTIVLVGPKTKNRKHIDWEISSSMRDTKLNPRAGVVAVLLPNHPDYGKDTYNNSNLPNRLAQNTKNGYVKIYDYPRNYDPNLITHMVNSAYKRKSENPPPNNSAPLRRKNTE